MIKISAIVGEKLKAVGTSFNKTVAGVSVSKVLASAAILRAGLSYTTGKFFNYLAKLLADDGTVSETLNKNLGKTVSETAGFTDSKNVVFVKRPTDPVGTAENFNRSVQYSRSFANLAAGGDNFNRTVIFSRSFQEPLLNSENIVLTTQKTLADPSYILDVYSRTLAYTRAFTEIVTATDDVNGAATDDDQNILFFKVLQNVSSVGDNYSRTIEYYRNFTDTGSTTDLLVRSTGKLSQDASSILDSYSRTVTYSRSFQDISVALENVSFDFSKLFQDTASTSELVLLNSVKNISDTSATTDSSSLVTDKSLTIFAQTQDSVDFTNTFNRTFTNTFATFDLAKATVNKNFQNFGSVLDIQSRTLSFSRQFSEQNIAADNFSRISEYFKNFTDNSNPQEFLSFATVKNLSDSIIPTDLFTRSVGSAVITSEQVSSTDDINGSALDDDQNILFFKVLSNTSSVSDTLVRLSTKTPAETSAVSDQGVLLNQSFIDPTYLAEDYVGDSRILT